VSEERRCPKCAALVAADAEWCGQCFTPMRPDPGGAGEGESAAKSVAKAPAATALATPGGGRIEVEAGGKPTWTCSVCSEPNAIDATICATCGAPFGRLLQQPTQRPEIKPQSAATWSLVWPGIGHWKAGYRADGIARMVLFAWTFGTLMILLVARFGTGGLGPVFPLVALFLIAASAVYAISAIDAYRLAGGDSPLVSSRVLLWGSAILIVASVALASFLTLPAVRQ
jgi:hypothetical protein